MPLTLETPTTANEELETSLAGIVYKFKYSFNTRDQRWRLSIYRENAPVILGIKIVENVSLLSQYILDDFDHGDIFCIRSKDDGKDVGLDNLGIGEAYELIYFSNEELQQLTS